MGTEDPINTRDSKSTGTNGTLDYENNKSAESNESFEGTEGSESTERFKDMKGTQATNDFGNSQVN